MLEQAKATRDADSIDQSFAIFTEWWNQAIQGRQLMLNAWCGELGNLLDKSDPDPLNLAPGYSKVVEHHLNDPGQWLQAQAEYCLDVTNLYMANMRHWCGAATERIIDPDPDDRRFNDPDWNENPLFDFIKQAYLLSTRHVSRVWDGSDFLPPKEASKLAFFTRQWVDAMAPTNYVATNPTVLRECIESAGANLTAGFEYLVEDMKQSKDRLQTPLCDPDAFELGRNIATTKGKVVFQNELFQLLQYSPLTEKVNKAPLLVVPPWINKYYILDLQPENSKVKWWVEQGHTVFIISWVNPGAEYANKTFDDYVTSGAYAALDAVTKATGESEVNAVGYCIGGTLLATTLAHMAAKGDSRIRSATFFTTLIDFSEPGDIGAFIDEQQVAALESDMEKKGYLEGSAMGSAFNMLRSNDLIWGTMINRYLRGKPARAFDLLYWNSDCTRMPARMHSFYLRQMYLYNRLCEPDGLEIAGESLDMRRIDIPVYFMSTEDDHIAPWHSTYQGAKLMTGPVRFVLSGSGHIAGVINPPDKEKYHYSASARNHLPDDPDQWLKTTISRTGSWWLDWAEWIDQYSTETVDPRRPGDGDLDVIGDAPGSFVKVRI